MFTLGKSLAITASAIGLICGTTGATQMPSRLDVHTPAHVRVAYRHQPQQPTATASMNGTRTEMKAAYQKSDGQCQRINDDGVRIRASYSTSAPVVGLAYRGDWFRFDTFYIDWRPGTDLRTGVHGWVSAQFFDDSDVFAC